MEQPAEPSLPPSAPTASRSELAALAGLFFRLGVTGFGGPAAHIAAMEVQVVRRRGWLSRQEFLDLVGATNLIPGPNSTGVALGQRLRGGRSGALWLVLGGGAAGALCTLAPG